jgi:hypothetical protein
MTAEPRRTRAPLPGAGDSAGANFVRSLGDEAAPFHVSLAGDGAHSAAEILAAERQIAAASPGVARGEGGIVHFRNDFPDDPHLRLWAGLVSAGAGNFARAADEFAAADALGLRGRGAALRQSLFPAG